MSFVHYTIYDEDSEEETYYDPPKFPKKNTIGNLYQADFHSTIFNLLIKLPGLCKQMQFYAVSFLGGARHPSILASSDQYLNPFHKYVGSLLPQYHEVLSYQKQDIFFLSNNLFRLLEYRWLFLGHLFSWVPKYDHHYGATQTSRSTWTGDLH